MKEDKNNQNDQPTEEQLPEKTQAVLREISKKELKQIIEKHEKWLESGGEDGKQADLLLVNLQHAKLTHANLQKANLEKANLQEADLGYANLQKASLKKANLQEANLYGANLQEAILSEANLQKSNLMIANLRHAKLTHANLQGANLHNANLQEANLRGANLQKADLSEANMKKTVLDNVEKLAEAGLKYANLEYVTGFLGNAFAQADVTGTKLPDGIKEFKALEIVKETSQNARKIFFGMLLVCVYSWLTIATTTDVRLLTNTTSSPLPIIGTEIPIAWFYIVAPLVIICLYFYFHLYLDNLWGALASLPAILPDGKRLDERAYPWLLNTLVRKHFKRLKSRPLIARMKEWITIFLAWMVVPITMIGFWLRYIPRHEWWGTIFHIGLIVISVAFAIIFYRLCALTLQGNEKVDFGFQKFWKDRRFYYGVSVTLVGILFSLLSYGAIEGVRSEYSVFTEFRQLVPWTFKNLGYDVFADFSEKDVSEKPDNYWEISKWNQLKSVKGANLKGRNLENADMSKAFLVKADFRGALLNGASLWSANLQQANLGETNLQQTDLRSTNLQEANLWNANLDHANLADVNLQQANLKGANLQQVYLGLANLQHANLEQANLQQAKLWNANLQQAYLGQAKLQHAHLVLSNLQQANLWNANLDHANLADVNLQQANLKGANLEKAHLEQANLQQANFHSADLTGAKNLTIEQLSKVKTLYQAKLDPELLEQVKKCCPHLLEKPKEEPDKSK